MTFRKSNLGSMGVAAGLMLTCCSQNQRVSDHRIDRPGRIKHVSSSKGESHIFEQREKAIVSETQTDDSASNGPVQVSTFTKVWMDGKRVEVSAHTCIDGGWLEQIACAPSSREHESLLVIDERPKDLHLALLMAGFEPGRPGTWFYEDDGYRAEPPTGDALEVLVRYEKPDGEQVEEPIRNWIREHQGRQEFPEQPWIFGGSIIEQDTDRNNPGEHYVADVTGSIIGLVTFGDEVIGFSKVLADQEAVEPAAWEVDTDHVPLPGTPVTVILLPAEGQRDVTSD